MPLVGAPEQRISDAPSVSRVGLLGRDYQGLKPRLLVAEGDRVALGQPLIEIKNVPGVSICSPGAGEVEAINRGARRVLQSLVIRLQGQEAVRFRSYPESALAAIEPADVVANLLDSGLWLAFRTRPYSKVPVPDSTPNSIFVTAIDTNPLAPDPHAVINKSKQAFAHGLILLARLTQGKVFVCTRPGYAPPGLDGASIDHVTFAGPHPAGLAGTHIHLLDPVSAAKTVWHIGYQDVIAIGQLFQTGELPTERVIAIAGPRVKKPRLLRTRLGASTDELTMDELSPGDCRVISGSVLAGHRAAGWASYLGRFHNQLSVLKEGGERRLFGWLAPGTEAYSSTRAYLSALFRTRKFEMSTLRNGSPRAMVPIGNFESVMPLDILPAPLLKSLLVMDTDKAQALGCLELDEEDLALCSFVCNGKYEYGSFLRENLKEIERSG